MNKLWKKFSLGDSFLLLLVCITVFLVPMFPPVYHRRIYDALFTVIVPASAFALQKNRKVILASAFAVTFAEWVTSHLGLLIATTVSRVSVILFFVWIVISLVIQVASTRKVTSRVIIDSICGYLLMGTVFTLMVALVMLLQGNAFNLPAAKPTLAHQPSPLSDYFYYTFVTFATLGYGDVVPKTHIAKALATLIAVVGQLYLATIVAMLIGKYASSASEEDHVSKE